MATQRKDGEIDTSNMLRQASSAEIADRNKLYDLRVSKEEVKAAVETEFAQYVEQDAQEYMMEWLGYFDPRDIIAISRNLSRKLRLDEVMFFGGPDGDQDRLCDQLVNIALDREQVNSFDQLREEEQRKCYFKAGWGLEFNKTGPIIHILNVMLDESNRDRSMGSAFLSLDPAREPFYILGNEFVVDTVNGNQTTATVSGRLLHISEDGGVFYGQGQLGLLQKHLRQMSAKYYLRAFTMNPEKLLAPFIKAQKKAKKEEMARRVNVSRNFAQSLFNGNPKRVAQGAPIK